MSIYRIIIYIFIFPMTKCWKEEYRGDELNLYLLNDILNNCKGLVSENTWLTTIASYTISNHISGLLCVHYIYKYLNPKTCVLWLGNSREGFFYYYYYNAMHAAFMVIVKHGKAELHTLCKETVRLNRKCRKLGKHKFNIILCLMLLFSKEWF